MYVSVKVGRFGANGRQLSTDELTVRRVNNRVFLTLENGKTGRMTYLSMLNEDWITLNEAVTS